MLKKQTNRKLHQQGFIQAALLFGIALITAVLGGFALANRSPTSQTDAEQAKVNASVILKQASDLRDGVARYASDFGSSAVLNTLDLSATANTGLFDPQFRYASPQIMPRATFRDPTSTYATIKSPSAAAAGSAHRPGQGPRLRAFLRQGPSWLRHCRGHSPIRSRCSR